MTRKFLDERGPKNALAAENVYPYAKTILIALQIIRIAMTFVAFKWTKVTKGTFYVESLI